MKRLGAVMLFAVGCAAPEVPLPPGGICMDVSQLEDHQVEALLVASERWEPHFEPVEIVRDPGCENRARNDVWRSEFDKGSVPAFVEVNLTPLFQRADTNLYVRPGLEGSQVWLEDVLTHEFAHIFGSHDHYGVGLMAASDSKLVGTGLTPSEKDRAVVLELYESSESALALATQYN